MTDQEKARLRWAFVAHEHYVKALYGGAAGVLSWREWKDERDKALIAAGLPSMTELDEAVNRRVKDQEAVKAIVGVENA